MRIIFLGTPTFAVAPLEAMIKAGFEVVAVVTAPDKPAGRGLHLHQSPVKQFALTQGIPVLQPVKLKDPAFIEELRSYKADLQVVIAFRMLPEQVWNMPPMGTINLHASLLPDYRGAAPINWAIINGEKETGVCTFFLKHEIDTGDLIDSRKTSIPPEMNAGELHDKLMLLGSELIVETLQKVTSGNYVATPQGQPSHKVAPKLFTADCAINWERKGEDIYNLIRGLSPYPGAFTHINGKLTKVYSADFVPKQQTQPGTIQTDYKTYFGFDCLDGTLFIKELQTEGKKKMLIQEFLNGYRNPNRK